MNRFLRSQFPPDSRNLAVFDTTTGSSPGRTRGGSLQRMLMLLGVFALGLFAGSANAQLTPVTYDFNANSTGWTGDITRTTQTTACGSASMRRNLYSGATTGSLVSPLLAGTNTGTLVTISYKYKAANWSANTVGTNPWGSFDVQYGPSATGPWTTFATVSQETQNGTCITKTHTFTPPTGNLYIKWACTWTAGDYYINFDDVVISQAAPPACAGMPNTPVATLTGASTVCAGATKVMSATGLTTDLGVTNQWMVSSTSGSGYANVVGGTGATTNSYTTAALTAGTYYYVLASTCTNTSETAYSNELTVTVNALPTIVVSPTTVCGVNPITASGASTYTWSPSNIVSATSGATVNYTGTSSASVTVSGTDANGCVGTLVQPITYVAPDPITISSSVSNFCGTSGTTTLTASATTASYTYTWTNLETGSLSTTSGSSTDFTVSSSAAAQVTGVDAGSGCVATAVKSVGVYPLPSANVTTTASGVCPGTPATINSGLSAGNFSATCIPVAPLTIPSTATYLANNGVASVALTSGGLDDGGWSSISLGFNFNFFGTSYSTVNVGTNGVLQFGTYNATALGDYIIGALPNTVDPLGAIYICANDLNCGTANSGGSPSYVRYWTEGYAPNRKFVIEYRVSQYGNAANVVNVQAICYETLGVVDIIAKQILSTNAKSIGVNSPTGTVGAAAPNCAATPNTANYWAAQTATIASTSPQAWRFSPPSNYTVNWYANSVLFDSGTNVFSESVAPLVTTDYSILYTNQLTNCSNALSPASVTMLVLSDVAPTGVNALSSLASVCSGVAFNLSTSYTGLTDGLAFQWQVSTDGGSSWADITGAVAATYSASQTVASSYRCGISSCGGTVEYTSQVDVGLNNYLDCYCTSTALYSSDEEITNVTMSTLNNSSDCVTPAPGAGSSLALYSNYTSLTPVDLLPGAPYSGTFTVGSCGTWNYNSGAAIFIDFNANGSFADAGEMVWNSGTSASIGCYPATTVPFSFSVPATATTGLVRMRIIDIEGGAGSSINPCGTYGYGETEDYMVNILPPPPAPVVVDVTPMMACPGATVTITGTDFAGIMSVTFNGTPAVSYTVVSSTEITAQIPTSVTGLVAVDVTNAGGTGSGGVLLYAAATTSISGQLALCGATPASLTAAGTGSFSWTVADACTYSISLLDTYGDGWNGGQVDVLVDGVLIYDNITLASGTGPLNFDFSVYAGSTVVINRAATGSFVTEQHYNIYSGPAASGSLVYASPNGFPSTYSLTATLCGSTPMGSSVVGSSATLSASTAGLYTVEFTDANGCTATASAAVASQPVPNVTAPSQVTACDGGQVTITATETTGATGVSYVWTDASNAVVGTSASVTSPFMFADDFYTVVASTAYCSSAPAYTGIVVAGLSGIVLTPINVSCNGAGDGSFSVAFDCGTTPFTYSVVPTGNPAGSYGALPTNLQPGTYDVYVLDADFNLSLPIALTITEPAAITAAVTTTNAEICSGLTSGIVTATVGSGNAGGSFGTNLQSPGPATNFGPLTVNVPAGATLTGASLVITNAAAINGSWRSEMRFALSGGVTLAPTQISTLTGDGTIASYTINIPAASVTGGAVTLTLSESYDDGGAGVIDASIGNVELVITYTYPQNVLWFADAAATNLIGMGSSFEVVGSSVCASPAASGTYTVYAAYTDGSCVGTPTAATLTVSGLSGVVLTPVNLTCFESNDGSFTQTETCGTAPYSYSVVATGSPAGTYGALPTNLVAGTYDVYVMDSNSELAGPISITITQPVALPSTTTTDGTACVGATVGEVSAVALIEGSTSVASGAISVPVISNGPAGTSTLSVAGIPAGATLTGITVNMTMTHTWDSDASISLIGPDAISVDLSSGNGGSGDNYTNTTFSSSATTPVTSGAAPFTGTFLPEGDLSTLYANTNGAWTLSVIDNVGGDDGNIQNWSLTLTYAMPGDVIWYADAAGTVVLGTGSPFNLVGTSACPVADAGSYTAYAAAWDGTCNGALAPVTLVVGAPLTATITPVVVATTSAVFASNFDMTGFGSASGSATISLPPSATVLSATLEVSNVVAQGFNTDNTISVALSGAATLSATTLGTSGVNLNGEQFAFPVSVDPAGGLVTLNITNSQGWWGDALTFGSIQLTVAYSAPAEAVICPGATLELGVSTTGGGGPQAYTWFNNGTQVGTGATYTATVVDGDSYTVEVTDDCNTTPVASAAYVPVFDVVTGGAIAGDLVVLGNDPLATTPGIGNYTLTGNSAGTIDWVYSTSPSGPWISIGISTSTASIDFSAVSGTYYIAAQTTSTAGCDALSNVLAVETGLSNDQPCDAYPLAFGDQGAFVWTPNGATVDAGEVTAPAGNCNSQTTWCGSNLNGSVWFSLVAPPSGHVSIQAPGFDDKLAIYSATDCNDYSTFTLINANDDGGTGINGGATFSAFLSNVVCLTPGQTYYVQLDSYGSTGNTTMVVTDLGNTAPVISNVPADISVSTTTACSATATWTVPTMTDDQQACATLTSDYSSGASFPVGTTTVTYTATDANGLTATASFTVTVTDVTAPTITAPAAVSVNAALNACTATPSLGTPVTADNCTVSSVTSDAPTTFPIGTTTVTWTVTDAAGLTATATQTVTVSVNPGNVWYVDADGDNYGSSSTSQLSCTQPVGYVANNTDCNDNNAAVHPGTAEVCFNGIDDNCSGVIDEGCPAVPPGENPSNAISATTSIWPNCSSISGTLVGASSSSASQSFCITGEDKWYQFVATSEAVSIVVNSTTNDIVIELQTAAGMLVTTENSVNGLGGEILTFSGLTAGQLYKLGIRNFDSAAGIGTFTVCVRMLKRGGCDYGAGPYSLCNYFKASWAGASGTQYRYTFTGLTGPAAGNVYTRTQATDICVLSNVTPTLPYGSTYSLLITNIFTINNAAGQPVIVEVPALTPCTMITVAEPATALRTSDQCAAGPKFRGGIVAALPWVCGANNWRWRFTEVDPITHAVVGIPFEVLRGAASNYLNLGTVTQLQYGKTYAVQSAPIFAYTASNYAWGPETYMCIVGTAGMVVEGNNGSNDEVVRNGGIANGVNLGLYPNPTHGENVNINLSGVTSDNVQIRIVDAMGRQVYSNRFAVDGILNTNLTFQHPLANGLYMVEAIFNGEVHTQRMMVQK